MSPNYSNEVMSTKIKKLKNNSLSLTLRTLFLFHEFLLITLTIIPLNLKKAFVNYELLLIILGGNTYKTILDQSTFIILK